VAEFLAEQPGCQRVNLKLPLYSGIYHFDSKGAITEYIREKQPQLAEKMSVIYISFYISSLIMYEMMKPTRYVKDFVSVDLAS
jgi:hypothetical protein